MTDSSPRTRRTRTKQSRSPARGAVATIKLWEHAVGAVAEDPMSGAIVFEFAESFRSSGVEISPLLLPLSTRGPQTFPALQRSPAFEGLPGVLADSLPDAFGNAIIARYFRDQGRPAAALSPVQKLLYIGQRAMGALEFHPARDGARNSATSEALEIASLVEQARHVVQGDTTVAIPEIMQVGASAGGARAKALIRWNRATNEVRSGFAPARADYEPWLIKFDGVSGTSGGHDLSREFRPSAYGRIEYAYSRMARTAGIDMAETFLLRERDFAHFMTRRFDRVPEPEGELRLHMHTLGGMLHVDYNNRQAASYEDLFRTIRALRLGQPWVNEAYRRMVFNLMARNQDDHVKNIAFLMHPDGRWRLAPAYDMTWAVGGQWAQSHQMTVAGKGDHFSREDLLDIGAKFDIPHDGAALIADVSAALDTWPDEARAVDLDASLITQMQREFRRFGK